MTIPFNDLRRHYSSMAAELDEAAARVIRSGWYVLGPEVSAFEQEWADFCGAAHCVSLANGSDALLLGLRALGVGAGDEVLTVANAGTYTTYAAHNVGATPRYVDVEPTTATLDPTLLAAAITPRTKVIVPVHVYGRVANLTAIMALAAEYNLPVLEDCAQAHGAQWHGRHVGTWGVAGCFSFYPTKNLGALGDGGALITNDPAFAERVRQLRTYGWSQKYTTTVINGTNSRLDELQAAVLRVKLRFLVAQNARRREIAARYNAGLAGSAVQLFATAPVGEHVHHLFVIQVAAEDRAALQTALRELNIGSDVHYPVVDHRQPAWADQYADLSLPVTEQLAATVLSLPCYPELTDAEVDTVIAAVRGALQD